MDKTPVKGGRWRTHSCALERERIASLRPPLLERVGHSPDAPPKKEKEKRKEITKQKGRCTSVPLRCGRVGNLEPLWREVLEGGSRASAPKVSRARRGGANDQLAS